MTKLRLTDIVGYIKDTQKVELYAYEIPLFSGEFGDIPAKFTMYEIDPQSIEECGHKIIICLDC